MRPTVEELEEALDIPQPASELLYMEDSRRLTGPGLLWEKPGAIVEVVARKCSLTAVETLWQHHARLVLDAVGWPDEQSCSRPHEDGLNLAISAPMDQLYSAIFVAQAAWHYTACELLNSEAVPLQQMLADLKRVMTSEANPAMYT